MGEERGQDAAGRPARALVREVSPRLADCELTHLERRPIDVARARRQHAAYCALLNRLGRAVVALPPAPDLPDAVFVEDAVVVVDDLAVLTRPGAASRRPEVDTVRAAIPALGLRLAEIRAPATLDGGDVLQVGGTVYVGLTARTDAAAHAQLAALLEPLGRRVVSVRVSGALHLKSAVTALPDGSLLAVPGWLDTAALAGREVVAAAEPAGADVLLTGGHVVVSAAAPRTAEQVAARGFPVSLVQIDEFEKAEAGVTCLSVLVPPAG